MFVGAVWIILIDYSSFFLCLNVVILTVTGHNSILKMKYAISYAVSAVL